MFFVVLLEIILKNRNASFVICTHDAAVDYVSLTEPQSYDFFTKLYELFREKTPEHTRIQFRNVQNFFVKVEEKDGNLNLKFGKEGGSYVDCVISKSGACEFSSNTETKLVMFDAYGVSVIALTVFVKEENLRLIVFYSESLFHFVIQTVDMTNLSLVDIFGVGFKGKNIPQKLAISIACSFLSQSNVVNRNGSAIPVSPSPVGGGFSWSNSLVNSPIKAENKSDCNNSNNKNEDSNNVEQEKIKKNEQQKDPYSEIKQEEPGSFFTKEILVVITIIVLLSFFILVIWVKVFLNK